MIDLKSKGIVEIASAVALLSTPLLNWILPDQWLDGYVAPGLDVKDTVNIIIILVLSVVVLTSTLPVRFRRYFHLSPFYERVEHSFFYQDDGTFTARSLMVMNSGWTRGLQDLPPEGFLWFNEVVRDRLHYRLIHLGRRQDRSLAAHAPRIERVPYNGPRQGELSTSLLSWKPRVVPPMERFETIAYQVEVTTPGTESAAFHPQGTILGFGVTIPSCNVVLRAFAPPGFVFTLVEPACTIRDYDSAEEVETVTKGGSYPTLSVDHSVVEVKLTAPRTRRRYWVHYRFSRAGEVQER